MKNGTKGLEVHPEIKKLIWECEMLTEELTNLICDRDYLMTIAGPNLEADYQVKVGIKEYQVFCLQCTVRRLHRKIELIQAEINRGRSEINLQIIEKQLDDEFTRWEQEMYEFYERIKQSRHRLNSFRSIEESQEIKRIYRALATSLHPDVNSEFNEKIKNLWLRVQDAYERGDLDELRTLELLLEDLGEECEITTLDSHEHLYNRREDLKKKIEYYRKEINYIKREFPFNIEKKLQDQFWVKEQHSKADEVLAELEGQKDFLERIIKDMSSESDRHIEVH